MKKYASKRAGKGKTAYRTPSTWKSGRPEYIKNQNTHKKQIKIGSKFGLPTQPYT